MNYEIKFAEGKISGDFSFSTKDNVITVSGFVKDLPETVKEVFLYEAQECRTHYDSEVERLHQLGEKCSGFAIKKQAQELAKQRAIARFGEFSYSQRVKASAECTDAKLSMSRPKKKLTVPGAQTVRGPKPIQNAIDADFDFESEFKSVPSPSFEEPTMEYKNDIPTAFDAGAPIIDPFDLL